MTLIISVVDLTVLACLHCHADLESRSDVYDHALVFSLPL